MIYLYLGLIFRMKKLTVVWSSFFFILLICNYIEYAHADHLEPGAGIFADKGLAYIIETKGSPYQVYVQTVVRDADGLLISVVESTATGAYVPALADHTFDTLMGEKEIITVGNIKYEKVQYTHTPSLEYRFIALYPIYTETAFSFEQDHDEVVEKYGKEKDYSIWKIHYCAPFEGHGYECIPVFQVLIPQMTLGPHDVVTNQWTIIRQIDATDFNPVPMN